MLNYNKNLTGVARKLREHMTDAERLLWHRVRLKQLNGCQFYRQKPIGNYIVDFFCPGAKLVIEVDGGQHFLEETAGNDRVRDEYLAALGLRVLRFSNREVLEHINAVVESIAENLEKIPLSPPFSKGEINSASTASSPFNKGRVRRISPSKIPLSPPLLKGETITPMTSSPFRKGRPSRVFQEERG